MAIDLNKKLAGIMVPAFALRTDNDLGIGDIKAVKEAIDFCHDNYLGVLQLLPINETGGDNSPYNAISALALDPVYIHMSTVGPYLVPGLTAEHLRAVGNLSTTNVINYKQVKELKHNLLEKAFTNFASGQIDNYKELENEFSIFQNENKNWLVDYTIFRTIVANKNNDAQWTNWEKDFKSIYSARIWATKDKKNTQACRFYAFSQWVAHRQWAFVKAYADKYNVKLIGDIPFGVSRYSADVWANPGLFDLEWSGGAPPERFFQADDFTINWGQNWGIPLYYWKAHEKENYAWWHSRINQVTKYFHGFRLDHVLGFFRIYAFPWIPERNQEFTYLTEEEAKNLTDDRLPQFMPRADDIKESAILNCKEGESRLKMILQAAGDSFVLAEDLGMVPEYVRPLLKKLGIPGFAIPIYERNEVDRSFVEKEKLPSLSLGTYGTHDNDPLVIYYQKLVDQWHGENGHEGWLEVQRLMRFLGLDENNPPKTFTNELHIAFLQALLSSSCWLTVFMITDLIGSAQRFNQPGTSSSSNWSERLEKSLAEYTQDKKYNEKIQYLRKLIVETKRQPYTLDTMPVKEEIQA